ncbi:hypothetical protein ES703_22963 [subsurface metagenome]
MTPERQGLVVIDGHPIESSWIANKVTVGRYGADFNVIQDAIDYCDAIGGEWTILIYPRGEAGAAFYNEGDIAPNGGALITLKGMGEGRVRIAPTVAPAVAVIVSAHPLNLEDIEVTAPTNAFPALRVTGGACVATRCELNGVAGGALHDAVQQVGGTLTLHESYIPVGDIDLTDAACTLIVDDCDIHGPLDTSDGAGANVLMTVTVNHTDCNNQAFNLAATGACVYEFHSNNEMGTITDASLGAGAVNGEICRCHIVAGLVKNGTTGWLIDNSELVLINSTNATGEITVAGGFILTVTSSAGIIRLVGAFYRDINRSATGNIVDQSPWLGDQPWHVEKWDWQAALANRQTSVRGTPLDAGGGQILLEVNTSGAVDREAVETFPAIAGALANNWTPARTPRFLGQIAVDNFHGDADMFFGLRETPDDYVPDITGAGEQCAGFDWDGTDFRAISTNGAGAGISTNLTIPTINTQVQLEVIIFGGVQVEFYVDGVLVATHNTVAGIPTAVLEHQHLLNNGAGGGAAADIDVTVRNGGCQECPV